MSPIGIDSRPSCILINQFNDDEQVDLIILNDENESFGSQMIFSTGYLSQQETIALAHFDNDQELVNRYSILSHFSMALIEGECECYSDAFIHHISLCTFFLFFSFVSFFLLNHYALCQKYGN